MAYDDWKANEPLPEEPEREIPEEPVDFRQAILDVTKKLHDAIAIGNSTDQKLLNLIEIVVKRVDLLESRLGYLETRLTIAQNYITKLEARLDDKEV